jgi:putative transposase
MPRKPRFFLADVPLHIVQRGNNRQAIFFADNDYEAYLGWVKEAAERYDCGVHAYVLMTNHVHLLLTPRDGGAASSMMQYVGRRYVPHVNQKYRRTGTLWEGRFRASLVQEERYLLACYRYLELNPVRAAVVSSPAEYPWSSYRHNALGHENQLLTSHPVYCALGKTSHERRAAYRELFADQLDPGLVKELRACVQSGTPFGNHQFREQVEQILARKLGSFRRGRPRQTGGNGNFAAQETQHDLQANPGHQRRKKGL